MLQVCRRTFAFFNRRNFQLYCRHINQHRLTSHLFSTHVSENSTSPNFLSFHVHTDALSAGDEDSDAFGQLAEKQGVEVFHYYPGSEIEKDKSKPFIPIREKKSAYGFQYECSKLAKQGKLDECVDLLTQTMLKEQKVQPLESNFSVVIGALGRNGDVSMAMIVFNKLKDYGLTATAPTYTALFNAFANSTKANFDTLSQIYQNIPNKAQALNRISYNALLKAYAKHDSLQNCMSIFRDSIAAGYEPDVYTFSHVLLSCNNDLQSGSRHAIQLFQLMLSLDIKPSGQFLLHFLQVLMNCDIGDVAIANRVLLKQQPENLKYFLKKHIRNFRWLKKQEPLPNFLNFNNEKIASSESLELFESEVQEVSNDEQSNGVNLHQILKSDLDLSDTKLQIVQNSGLNLLERNPSSELLSIESCPKASDRLKLVGGFENMLRMMNELNIKPNTKLLTVMISLLDDNCTTEDNYMSKVEKLQVKLDADFYNFMMRKRAKRNAHKEANEILQRMQQLNIPPNYRTWCIHAMSCRSFYQGRKLIEQVVDAKMQPDIVLFNTLTHAALYNPRNKVVSGYKNIQYPNYRYLSYILNQMKDFKVSANKKLINNLERAAAWPRNYNRWQLADLDFEKKIASFRKDYNEWLKCADCE